MTIYELIAINKELLERLYDEGIRTSDYKLVDLYEDYVRMRDRGDKITYIISILSKRYGISERSVYYAVGRLARGCKHAASRRDVNI